MDLTPLPLRAELAQYKKQATDLVMAYRSADPKAIHCVRQLHPRLRGRAHTNDRNEVTDSEIRQAGVTPADDQGCIARWYGFETCPTLTDYIRAVTRDGSPVWQFESAVEAIITGDVTTLKRLLRENPELVRARSTREHRATLLHYVSANGVEGYRQRTPKNAVTVARVLLEAGAEVDADLDYDSMRRIYPERVGSAPLGLVATSVHPAIAGVQIPLLKILLEYGASIDGLSGGWNPLIAALHNGRGRAAEFLAKRGARLDLEGAAGAGRLDAVKGFFENDGSSKRGTTTAQMESGFIWACEYGRTRVVAFLLENGTRIDALPHGETGLHQAAYGGHAARVKLLLKRKASVDIEDRRFGGTPLRWALEGWCYPPPEARGARYHEIVARLVAAGAGPAKNLDRTQVKKLRADAPMRAALRGEIVPL